MLEKRKIPFIFLICISLLILAFIIYKSLIMAATWDEALTYWRYVRGSVFGDGNTLLERIRLFGNSRQANNQLLNTFLIALCDLLTFSSYQEFVMRIPNILAYILLVYCLIKNYYTDNISFVECILILLCYPIIDFFSLARGYGIAFSLCTISLIMLKRWIKEKENINLLFCLLIILAISTTANTIVLLVEASVWIYIFVLLKLDAFKIINKNRFKSFIVFATTFISIVWHFWVSGDSSLYMDTNGGLITMIEGYFSFYTNRYLEIFSYFFIVVMLFSLIIDVINKYYNSIIYRFIFISHMLICIAAVIVTKKGYPLGRVLIPSYSLFVFCVIESISSLLSYIKNEIIIGCSKKAIALVTLCLMLASFINQIDFKYSKFWGYELGQKLKDDAYIAYKEKRKIKDEYENLDAITYYRNQILVRYGYDIFE